MAPKKKKYSRPVLEKLTTQKARGAACGGGSAPDMCGSGTAATVQCSIGPNAAACEFGEFQA